MANLYDYALITIYQFRICSNGLSIYLFSSDILLKTTAAGLLTIRIFETLPEIGTSLPGYILTYLHPIIASKERRKPEDMGFQESSPIAHITWADLPCWSRTR